jgi:ABC-type uncharacterized transport system substrate-binding protein
VRLAFLEGLRELGYVDDETVEITYRSGDMNRELLEFGVQDLVEAKVALIAAAGTVPSLVAKRLTRTIPIVMIFSSEPVAAGLVASLARPGGNVTGISTIQTEVDPKRLAMLKEISPGIRRVAALWTRFHPSHGIELQAVFKRSATYVHRIVHGTKPANLPVEQPSKFDFVVNAGTAAQLGLKLPPALMLLADRVIE